MKLFEFEAKTIFSKFGIPTPKGEIVSSSTEAYEVTQSLGKTVVVKAQVLAGGRGRAGGIKFAETPEEAREISEDLLGKELLGSKVARVLVEEKIEKSKEIYIGITVDRALKSYVLIASSEGGIDVEEVLGKAPEKLVKFPIEPLLGLTDFDARDAALRLGFKGKEMMTIASIIAKLYRIVIEYDAELAEINPLIETPERNFIAADARMILDDNSLYRHHEFNLLAMKERRGMSEGEVEAASKGFSYVELDGNIGVIGNGAGLVMTTLDLIQFYGGRPANFLDIGGGASAEVMKNALMLILQKSRIKSIVVNVMGGITHCDEVARGILEALKEAPSKIPIVVRMVGTREEEGRRLLLDAGLLFVSSMEEAAERAVGLALNLGGEKR